MQVRARAVGFGVAVEVVLALLAFIVPVAGHLAVGLAGGFVAGLLGGGGVRGGATHGAAAGAGGGIVLAIAGVAVAFALGVPTVLGAVVPFALSRAAFAGVLVVGALLLALAAAGGGALGGLVRGDRPLPSEPRVRGE